MRTSLLKQALMIALGLALTAGLAVEAAAAGAFQRLPKLSAASKQLRIRFVRYTGGTNGRMIVDIRNQGQQATTFSPKGLYFVPQVDPERAPQRLGAAGPFEVAKAKKQRRTVKIAPGQTVRLRLQVFCLDSHRASPSARHSFRVANKRLPKNLRKRIVKRAAKAYKANAKRGYNAQKSAIQSEVWRTRNEKWQKLEGERNNERAPKSKRRRPNRRMRQQIQINEL